MQSKKKLKKLDELASHPVQTEAWYRFRKKWGNKILVTKYGMITIHKVPLLGNFGVFFKGPKPNKKMLEHFKALAKENNIFAIRMEPNVEYNQKLRDFLLKNRCAEGKNIFTPTNFVIDIKKSRDSLLKSFSSKTRYHIKYAKRKGVKVTIDNSKKSFERYLELMRETVQRHKFYAHSEKYHRLMWQTLRKDNIANLLVAKYKGEILAAWVLFEWKDTLYYPYGGSTQKLKNLQFNSAMMWGAIEYGKKKGLEKFDLWGHEPGKGFSRFKKGFNPRLVRYIGTWDFYVKSSEYMLFVVFELIRWGYLKIKANLKQPSF